MESRPGRKTRLKNHDTVAVVGGGPAGSFFAIHLLRESRKMNRTIEVIIVEKKRPVDLDAEPWHHRGCNSCAGGISPRLSEVLEQDGITIPDEVVQSEVDHIWLQSLWKNFPLKVPEQMKMYTVFRGSLPFKKSRKPSGFDSFLLEQAVTEGARIACGDVQDIEFSPSGRPKLKVKTRAGDITSLTAEFVAIAAGVNAHQPQDSADNPLLRSVRATVPRYVPARTRKALLLELEVGRRYLKKNMNREVHFIEYGSKELQLEHIALIPKGDLLTVTLIGKRVDRAVFPNDTREILADLLRLPEIATILPGIRDTQVACTCAPRMAVMAAQNPFTDRVALVGDMVGSRLYKDGLYSAHTTAAALARTVLEEGIDKQSLARGYGPTVRWLTSDNRYGRWVFALSRLAFGTPVMSRVLYQAFATELKTKDKRKRPLGLVLWNIASGMADYREILTGMLSLSVLRSILVGGALVTLRNWLSEAFFGLKWGKYGRYPTVIVKEKRDAVKEYIASSLGTQLDVQPDFERMYLIKVKGSPEEVFAELGRFGESGRGHLELRFVDVKRVSGEANAVGSVIQYKAKSLGLSLELLLTRLVPDQTLYYEVSDRFVDRGKLIFAVNPTKDGNSRLGIYTAFDFKTGKSLPGKTFWRLSRCLFPAYIHDVVWNHALCRIKENVERAGCRDHHESARRRLGLQERF
jgi:flavin-dependent dehydrogenase